MVEYKCFAASPEDLLTQPVTKEVSREEAEVEFVCQRGLPETVIKDGLLVKMFDDSYWSRKTGAQAFVPVAMAEGRNSVVHFARFNRSESLFSGGSKYKMKAHVIRNSDLYNEAGAYGLAIIAFNAAVPLVEKKLIDHSQVFFAGVEYFKANDSASFAYANDSKLSAMLLSQGLNECATAAILNANMWTGKVSEHFDRAFLAKAHDRLLEYAGAESRLMNTFALINAGKKGLIDGLSIEIVMKNLYENPWQNVARTISLDVALVLRRPLIALVQTYGGHAVAIVGKEGKLYRTIDTISGEEQFYSLNEIGLVFSAEITDIKKFKAWVERAS